MEEDMIEEGAVFPDFELMDQHGAARKRSDFRGKPTVFYFYPKDDTPGCTKEACGFRDQLPRFAGAHVVGISPDSAESHGKFAKKHGLDFPLLADTEHLLAEACGVWVEKSMYGKKYMGIERTTFLVDSEGVVRKVWRIVKPEGHAEEVLEAISKL
ncbi:MAG: thioredoxin-dependent thiol peroxidase [Fimbriimonadales bacterium]|nr:thioredoxin-dependent thiol peroxidase [Fimbriimonadales bacterium]